MLCKTISYCTFLAQLPVTIISDAGSVVCVNATITLTCVAPNATQYNWTTTGVDHSAEVADVDIIVVTATPEAVKYTCTVTNGNGNTGKSNVTVVSNGM